MKICDFCQEPVSDYTLISNITYCRNCVQSHRLIKCPFNQCNNIISLNNPNIENSICDNCNTAYCFNCITRNASSKLCNDCIYVQEVESN